MKSALTLLLVLGIMFHPSFLMAAEDAAAPKAADAAVAAEESQLEEGMDDWELGADDLAAEDEDLQLDEEEDLEAPAADGAAAAK